MILYYISYLLPDATKSSHDQPAPISIGKIPGPQKYSENSTACLPDKAVSIIFVVTSITMLRYILLQKLVD